MNSGITLLKILKVVAVVTVGNFDIAALAFHCVARNIELLR